VITQKWLKANGAPASFVEWLRWKLERNHADRMSKASVMKYLTLDGCVEWMVWLRTATESKIMRRALAKFKQGDKVVFNPRKFKGSCSRIFFARDRVTSPIRYGIHFYPFVREGLNDVKCVGRIVALNGIAARVRFERDVRGWGSRNRYQDCDPRDLIKVTGRKRG
jgi:hypothetical protein